MRITSILLTTGMLFAVPFASHAEQPCEHSAARNAELNLGDIKTVVFDIGPHTLALNGDKRASGSIRGKACASDAKRLAELVVTQQRDGEKLIVRAERNGLMRKGSWSGESYGYLTLTATIPDNLAVRIKVGSGDAVVDGVASLSADVGSGDLEVRHVRNTFYAEVGSGDVHASDIGALHVVSVGSGDLSARDLRGNATVGEIHSGDLVVANAKGKVEIGSIGSGDARLSGIAGSVTVATIGSGDLEANGVGGDLVVDAVGSGSVGHRNVKGKVRVPEDD
jgi:Putative adhesin